ncbi:hypothetical protein MRX96_009592 [Rhipicephalus microplus]
MAVVSGMAVVSDTAEASALDMVSATVVDSMEGTAVASTAAMDVVSATAEDSTAERDNSSPQRISLHPCP